MNSLDQIIRDFIIGPSRFGGIGPFGNNGQDNLLRAFMDTNNQPMFPTATGGPIGGLEPQGGPIANMANLSSVLGNQQQPVGGQSQQPVIDTNASPEQMMAQAAASGDPQMIAAVRDYIAKRQGWQNTQNLRTGKLGGLAGSMARFGETIYDAYQEKKQRPEWIAAQQELATQKIASDAREKEREENLKYQAYRDSKEVFSRRYPDMHPDEVDARARQVAAGLELPEPEQPTDELRKREERRQLINSPEGQELRDSFSEQELDHFWATGQMPTKEEGGGKPKPSDIKGLQADISRASADFSGRTRSIEAINRYAEQDSAAGDYALIVEFAKYLDPTSVVRESEFDTIEAIGSFPVQARQLFDKFVIGNKLTPEQRDQITGTLAATYPSMVQRYEDTMTPYKYRIGDMGIPEDRFSFVKPYDLSRRKSGGNRVDATGMTEQEINALPPGTQFFVRQPGGDIRNGRVE
jgi:hypothetical protein